MKRILMIATGGTIASKETAEGLAPALSSQELLACVPEVAKACSVQTVQPFNLDSTNVRAGHWLDIARIIEENYDGFDGFVVTHGTDTMAYTAAALSYLVQNSAKPIVLTGSQKSVYSRDTDARKNLTDAFLFCADDRAFGVRIVFDGSVILGTRAKKTRTRSYNAFSSIDYPAVAVMREGAPFYYIEWHCDGLVIESFGAGGLPNYENDAFRARLSRFLSLGKTAVLTTQVEREGSALDTYAVGRKLRSCGPVLEARCMTLEATVAKLMWILSFAKGKDAEKLFYTPVERDIF